MKLYFGGDAFTRLKNAGFKPVITDSRMTAKHPKTGKVTTFKRLENAMFTAEPIDALIREKS